MSTNHCVEQLKLRPHHTYCHRFHVWDSSDRGEAFNRVKQKITGTIESGRDAVIEFVEGVDELCNVCSFCQNDRCQNPQGNEDETRKWDAIILKGLGISYGDRMTAKELSELTDKKAPLAFCQTRCRYRDACLVFKRNK